MILINGMQHRVLEHYQVYWNDAPGLTLTYFTARSNLVPCAFVWGKVKTMDFLETIVVYDIKVGRYNQLNEFMKLYEYQRSRSFINLGPNLSDSNDAPGLTLTYFTARSNLVPCAFVWEKVKTMDFSETIVVYNIKVGRCTQLNEFMKLYGYQRSRSFINLGPNLSVEPPWDRGTKVCSNGPGHMTKTKMATIATFKNLLWNRKVDNLETWYAALSTRVLPSMLNWCPWVDLDLFYGKVKFGPLRFCMGKS